jgi:hypothetical protein
MIKKPINYLVISDIHLGSCQNKASQIIKNLLLYFDNYQNTHKLDILFLAGDVFERLLEFPSPDSTEIIFWVHRIISFCREYSIKLRVLEGTPSHDWKQSKIFETINLLSPVQADVRYIDKLSIEHMPDFNLYIIYVPDEWSESSEETFQQAKKQLADFGITHADIAIMHGLFTYQLPFASVKNFAHSETQWLSIVKYFISIGHIHTFSVFDRIVAQGSIDRHAHGEEEPKGGVLFNIHPTELSRFRFIENKCAAIFKTINIKVETIEEVISLISKKTQKWPKNSNCRLRAKKGHIIFSSFEELKKRFIDIKLTKDVKNTNSDISTNLLQNNFYEAFTITKENIISLLIEPITKKKVYSIEESEMLLAQLKEVI